MARKSSAAKSRKSSGRRRSSVRSGSGFHPVLWLAVGAGLGGVAVWWANRQSAEERSALARKDYLLAKILQEGEIPNRGAKFQRLLAAERAAMSQSQNPAEVEGIVGEMDPDVEASLQAAKDQRKLARAGRRMYRAERKQTKSKARSDRAAIRADRSVAKAEAKSGLIIGKVY